MHTKEELAQLAHLETKLALCDAFEILLQQEPIDKVSVSKICQQAGISRATFYRIFQDKYEIVQWSIMYIHAKGVNQIGRTLNWEDGYYESEKSILRHKDFFTQAAKSNDYNSLDFFTSRTRKEILAKTVTEYYHQKITPQMSFMIDTAVDIETKAFPNWAAGKYDCSLREMCTWVAQSIPSELFNLLNVPLSEQNNPSNYNHFLLGKGF